MYSDDELTHALITAYVQGRIVGFKEVIAVCDLVAAAFEGSADPDKAHYREQTLRIRSWCEKKIRDAEEP